MYLGKNIYRIIILVFVILLISGAFFVLRLNYLKTNISVINSNQNVATLKIPNKEEFYKKLKDKQIVLEDQKQYISVDGQTQHTEINQIQIELVNQPQENAFIDSETNSKEVISFSHSLNKGILYVAVYIDKDYYFSIQDESERNRRFSSGVFNYIYKITHPYPQFNRQEVQDALQNNAQEINNTEPLLLLD